MATCDWCLEEGVVRSIDRELWRFWGIISQEDPLIASLRNICERCKARFEGFSSYVEACKGNESVIGTVLLSGSIKAEAATALREVKEEPSIDIESNTVIKREDPGFTRRVTQKRKARKYDPLTCPYCEKIFRYPYKLKEHLSVHAGDEPFVCPRCPARFSSGDALKTHRSAHRPFGCAACGKRFVAASDLRRHVRVHTGERPFKCPVCDNAFTQRGSLTYHLRVHTGDRPFKCRHCDRSFAQAGNLRSHARVHTGERPFACLHCDRRFSNRAPWKAHALVHATGDSSAIRPA